MFNPKVGEKYYTLSNILLGGVWVVSENNGQGLWTFIHVEKGSSRLEYAIGYKWFVNTSNLDHWILLSNKTFKKDPRPSWF